MPLFNASKSRRPIGLFTVAVATVGVWTTTVAAVIGLGAATGSDQDLLVLGQQTARVELSDFEISPGVIEVGRHMDLTLAVENVDETQHDLTISSELSTGRLKLGDSKTLELGVVDQDVVIWCSIKGHREQGMEATIHVVDDVPVRP